MDANTELATAVLNLGATLAAVLFLGWGLSRVAVRHRDGENRFLLQAMTAWWLSWLTWVLLWALIAADLADTTLITLLSDVNTVFSLLTYFSLTRGRDFSGIQAVILGVQAFVVVIFIDLGFDGFGVISNSAAAVGDLQARWSLALSVIGPLLFGWACALRFGTSWAVVVGFMYSAMQPFAYHAIFSTSGDKQQGWAVAILAILAMLKVAYAATGLACFGMMPRSADNLVRINAPQPDMPHAWGGMPSVALALAGGTIVWAVAVFFRLKTAQDIAAYLVGFIGLLGGVLKLVDC